jgi:hypothetical protein
MITPTRNRLAIALAIVLAVPMSAFADGRFTEARLMIGKQQVVGALISDTQARLLSFDIAGSLPFQIPFDKIRALYYERASQPRYAAGLLVAWPLLFTKSKQHFLTIQYNDASGTGKYQVLRLDKANVRMALETLEADTGIKIERTEER